MKARIKGTYEWLDFEATVLQNTEFITEGYLCVKTGEVYKKEDLVFLDEYKDTLKVEPPKSIDWENVRIQAAISAMQAIINSDALRNAKIEAAMNVDGSPYEMIALSATLFANSLVKQLKGE